jgi:hypothetical protein
MQLTVLSVPGCPNVALLEERLARLLAGWPGVRVTRRVIATEEEAARSGQPVLPAVPQQRGPRRRRPVGEPAPPGDRRAPSPPA